jgi:lipid-binding SYLF domain-containing protein
MKRLVSRSILSAAAALVLVAAPLTALGDDAKESKDKKSTEKAAEKAEVSDEQERAVMAAHVLEAARTAEDASIPNSLIENAWGIAVIPHVVKGAFGVGGHWGKGLVARRLEDGSWSAPAYVQMGGASYGFQIGVEATDLVLVFTDKAGLEALLDDKLKLGGNASIAAGPVGRRAEAGTNVTLDSAIYSYSRSKGLFAGVSLDGAIVDLDEDANHKVYGKDATAKTILSGKTGATADTAPLQKALSKHAMKTS